MSSRQNHIKLGYSVHNYGYPGRAWRHPKMTLDIPRPPQGRPVMVQAGASEAGQERAAETAGRFNIVPACTSRTLEDFAEYLRPELVRRGLVHSRYESKPSREIMGLSDLSGAVC